MDAFDGGVLCGLLRERWSEERHRARGGLLSCAGPLDRRRMGPWDRPHRWYCRPLVVWRVARLASHTSERLLLRIDAHAFSGRCSHVHGPAVSCRHDTAVAKTRRRAAGGRNERIEEGRRIGCRQRPKSRRPLSSCGGSRKKSPGLLSSGSTIRSSVRYVRAGPLWSRFASGRFRTTSFGAPCRESRCCAIWPARTPCSSRSSMRLSRTKRKGSAPGAWVTLICLSSSPQR